MDPSTGIVGLTIKKVKSDDEAKYTLKIQNDAGEERATFSVFVKCNNSKQSLKINRYMHARLVFFAIKSIKKRH